VISEGRSLIVRDRDKAASTYIDHLQPELQQTKLFAQQTVKFSLSEVAMKTAAKKS